MEVSDTRLYTQQPDPEGTAVWRFLSVFLLDVMACTTYWQNMRTCYTLCHLRGAYIAWGVTSSGTIKMRCGLTSITKAEVRLSGIFHRHACIHALFTIRSAHAIR